MDTTVSLERLVVLRTPVTWQEAVAIAQQVGRAARLADSAVGLDNCRVNTLGGVEVSGATRVPFVGDPAAGALHALLDRSQAPRDLLVLVDGFASRHDGRDLATELEFFARPDGAALVAGIATRALERAEELQQQAELERLRSEASSVAPPAARAAQSRRLAPVVFAGVAVVAAGIAIALFAARGEAPSVETPTEAPPEAATAAAAAPPETAIQKISSGLDSLVDKGMAALGLTTAAAAPAPATDSSPAAKPATPRLARRAPVANESAPLVLIMPPPATSEGSTTTYTAEISEETDMPVPPEMVHDASSANLQPPILRWPQLPQDPESVPVEAGVPYLEILINEIGTVDKVRLRAVRTSYHERMLVSAAKAWVFHPATKDGRPVKYLMRVPMIAQ